MHLEYLFKDPVPAPGDAPTNAKSLKIMGKRGKIPCLLTQPFGDGPHPTVLICHGYPGFEQHLDLAQALRRVGFCVATFHYSGSWGADGDFSFANCLEDTSTVLHALADLGPEYRIDRGRMYVVGHSMGGFVATHMLAKEDLLLGGAILTPFDVGRLWMHRDAEDVSGENLTYVLNFGFDWLRGSSAEGFARELAQNGADYCLEPLAPRLAKKPTLLVGATYDVDLPPDLHREPLRSAILSCGTDLFRYEELPCDHDFSSHRIALAQIIAKFLVEQAEG